MDLSYIKDDKLRARAADSNVGARTDLRPRHATSLYSTRFRDGHPA